MEIIGVTRKTAEGAEIEEFVLRCPIHDWYYKGRPPLTTGCRECWECYYIGQFAQHGSKPESVDQLESAIMHAKELIDKGEFDFKPSYEFNIEKEN
jgi:hypothetical protein